MDVKNHDLGGVITRSCKGHEIMDAILHIKHLAKKFRAVRSKCANCMLKVRYKLRTQGL